MSNKTDNNSSKRKATILKELESVKTMLNDDEKPTAGKTKNPKNAAPESKSSERKEEFQIPLLDPAKPTTFEIDFSKPKPAPEKKPAPAPTKPQEQDIPMVDDITSSSSLFDDAPEENGSQESTSMVTEKELKDKAQLIIQDLINDAITELEEKLDNLIPNLEERLKKRLEKAMDEYISDALKK